MGKGEECWTAGKWIKSWHRRSIAENGRPGIDPVELFKMVLLQHLYGPSSLRRAAAEVRVNVCYRWFLGYALQEETPHFFHGERSLPASLY